MILFLILFSVLEATEVENTSLNEVKNSMRFGVFLKDEIISIQSIKIPSIVNEQLVDIEYYDKTFLLKDNKVVRENLEIRYYCFSIKTMEDKKVTVKVNTNHDTFFIIVENNIINIQKTIFTNFNPYISYRNDILYLVKSRSIDDSCSFDCILDDNISIFTKLTKYWEVLYHSSVFEKVIYLLRTTMLALYRDSVIYYVNNCNRFNIIQTRVSFDVNKIDEICNKIRNMDIFTKYDKNREKNKFIAEIKEDIKLAFRGLKEQLRQLLIPLRKYKDEETTFMEKKVIVLYSEMYSFKNITELLKVIYDHGVSSKRLRRIAEENRKGQKRKHNV